MTKLVKALQWRPKVMPHSLDFFNDLTTEEKGLVGGYRAAKSYTSIQLAIRAMVSLHPGETGVACSPIAGMSQRNLVPILKKILPGSGLDYDKDALNRKCTDYLDINVGGGKTSRMLLSISAENYHRMNGMSLAWGFLDEADKILNPEIGWAAWLEMGSRLSEGNKHGYPAQQWACSTPEGIGGFMWQCFDRDLKNGTADPKKRKVWHISMLDNFLLPKDYVENRLRNIPKSKQAAYIYGHFVNMNDGLVYKDFGEHNNTTKTLADFSEEAPLLIGMDGNVGKMAMIVHVLANNVAYAVNEHLGLEDIRACIKFLKLHYPNRHIVIYPDSSMNNRNYMDASTTSYRLLVDAFGEENVICYSVNDDDKFSNPHIQDRVDTMNMCFMSAAGNISYYINFEKCPKYVQALQWQPYHNNKPMKDDEQDHCLDAAGYFIFNEFWVDPDEDPYMERLL